MHIAFFRKPVGFLTLVVFLSALLLSAPQRTRALDADKDLSQCRLDIWTTKDGLPPRDIDALAQTPDGYLWLGTRAGLVRFDGNSFKVYNSRNTPGMTRDAVCTLTVTRSGELWLGTDGGGFGRFVQEKFVRGGPKTATPRWSQIKAIHETRDGNLWFGGLGEPHFLCYNGRWFAEVSDQFQNITGMAEDHAGNLWFAANGVGLTVRHADGRFVTYTEKEGLPTRALTCVCIDAQDRVWAGTEKNGLICFAGGKCRVYTMRDGLTSNEIHSLCADQKGTLWIGTRDGLDCHKASAFHSFRKRDGLFDSSVGPMLEDREGNLWVGSGAGLNRFNNTKLTPFTLPSIGSAPTINTVCEGHDGSLWFALSSGLQRLHGGQVTTYGTRNGLLPGEFKAVWETANGTLWLLDANGGLWRGRNGHFTVEVKSSGHSLVSEDRQGLVFGGYNTTARLRKGKFTPLTGDAPGFEFTLHPDAARTLWIGCDKGLARIENNRVRVIPGLPPETHVLAITDGANGALWLGTDKGLAWYRDGTFTVYTLHDGLPDDNLYQILMDRQGALWVGGNRGIFVVRTDDLDAFDHHLCKTIPATLYEAGDGIRRFPLLGSALGTRDGKLWFKGDTGLTLIDPAHIRSNTQVPPVLVEQATLDTKPVERTGEASMPPGKGELEVRYTALSFVVPEKVRFRYRLEGYDKTWVEADTRRAAYYTNLPPGRYTFRVMACNNDGLWNMAGTGFTFTLRPAFYQTGAFKAACLLALALGVGGIYRACMWQLWRSNQLLEANVARRTEELQRSHAEIESINQQLHTLATTDGMTELANHRAFQDRLRVEWAAAEQTGRALTMLLVDVDHFKSYNDTFGHPAGDEVLRILAGLLRANVRDGDYVARYGGEEFAALLPNTDSETALLVAERIRQVVAAHVFPCRQVTLSIGVALHVVSRMAPEVFVQRADQALYAAKNAGRNRVILAEEETPTVLPGLEERRAA